MLLRIFLMEEVDASKNSHRKKDEVLVVIRSEPSEWPSNFVSEAT